MEDGQGVVLLGESSRIYLEGPLPAALVPLLTGDLSCDQIAERLAGRFDPALVYFHLIRLEQRGLLYDGRASESSPEELLLGQLGGDPAKIAVPATLHLTALGGMDPEPALERLGRQGAFQVIVMDWRAARPAADHPWVVLTPDYLEPELADFNRQALAQGWRWSPCQPWGIEPCFGPLFAPGETACLECLLHRLRGHRGAELGAWREGGRSPRLARGHSPAALDAVWGMLGLELRKALAGVPQAFLGQGAISLDLKSLAVTRHLLSRRPQCPACGDPAPWRRMPVEPPALRSRPKSGHRDGGERIWDATQTLSRLLPRVSPLTGEVGVLQDHENASGPLGCLTAATWAVLGPRRLVPPARQGSDWRQGRAGAQGISCGKGRTRSQARASALGEALERYSSQFCGYEPVIAASWAEVAPRAIHPQCLNPFSPAQYRDRLAWGQRGWTAFVPEPFSEQAVIDWSPAWCLSQGRWKLVPSACLYYDYPPERGGRFARGDSNGVAAGNCLEEAFMQGFFELVERDAVALWWYNRLRRRAVDLDSLGQEHCRQARAFLAERGFTLEVLDLTSDLPVPVLAAVALHDADPEKPPHLGFGCHLDARIALERSLAELAQGLMAPESGAPLDLARQLLGHPLGRADFLRPLEGAPPRRAGEFVNQASDDFLEDIHLAVEMLDRRGLEILMADLTRPETGLRVVRVMVPGLAHFWPRLATERLYSVPVEQGWLSRPLREEELNPLPFYL